jgi:protein-disulfide isomerase
MQSKFSRQALSYSLIVLCTVMTSVVMRRNKRPFSPSAPAFRVLGPENAKITIVEYSDFQCPACRNAEGALHQVLNLYQGNVRFVFKHLPLKMHAWAVPAAVAAECAGAQGRFWPYHDRLYDQQAEWSNEKAESFFTRYAQELKLDLPACSRCRENPETAAMINAEVQDGRKAWVGSTPTFFVNEHRFVGGKQLAELGTLFIDRELKK